MVVPIIFIGGVFSEVSSNLAPIELKGSDILCIGLLLSEESPFNSLLKLCQARTPAVSLMPVPEFPKYKSSFGLDKPFKPLPKILYAVSSLSIFIPNCLTTFKVFKTSSLCCRLLTVDTDFARAEQRIAL